MFKYYIFFSTFLITLQPMMLQIPPRPAATRPTPDRPAPVRKWCVFINAYKNPTTVQWYLNEVLRTYPKGNFRVFVIDLEFNGDTSSQVEKSIEYHPDHNLVAYISPRNAIDVEYMTEKEIQRENWKLIHQLAQDTEIVSIINSLGN